MKYKTKCTECGAKQETVIIEVCPECNERFEVDDCNMSDAGVLVVKCPECNSRYETVIIEVCEFCNHEFEMKIYIDKPGDKISQKDIEDSESDLNENLFTFQKHVVGLARKEENIAIFTDTGFGKTAQKKGG